MVKNTLGLRLYQVSRISLIFDYTSSLLLYAITSYNLFQKIIFNFGLLNDNDLSDKGRLEFKEYTSKMIIIRFFFFLIFYIVSIPTLLKRKMEHMRWVSILFLFLLIILLLSILIQMPFYWNKFRDEDNNYVMWSKDFSIEWITIFFAMNYAFNLQIYGLDIKKELLYPSWKRLTKINRFSTFFEFMICASVGIISYCCLGDKHTPRLIILRSPFTENGIFEYYLKFLIIIFFITMIIAIPVFNPSVRSYYIDFFNVDKEKYYNFFSLVPYLVVCLISFGIPNINKILEIFGITCFNYDAYIVPLLMKLYSLNKEDSSFLTKIFYIIILVGLIMLSFIGFGYCVYDMFK